MQLLVRQWLAQVEEDCGQKKLAITGKGVVFLEKWFELQKLAGIKSKRGSRLSVSQLQALHGLTLISVPNGFSPSKTASIRSGKNPLIT